MYSNTPRILDTEKEQLLLRQVPDWWEGFGYADEWPSVSQRDNGSTPHRNIPIKLPLHHQKMTITTVYPTPHPAPKYIDKGFDPTHAPEYPAPQHPAPQHPAHARTLGPSHMNYDALHHTLPTYAY